MELRRSVRIQARTRPVAPTLETAKRTRYYHIESQEEKDQKEFEEIQRYKFRARPPPSSIFGSNQSGVPKKEKKKLTKAKTPMALKRKKTSAMTKAKNKTKGSAVSNNAMKRLKALPLPDLKKVFELAKEEKKLTKPKPFSFETKYAKPTEIKAKLLAETVEEEKKKRDFKAQPLYEMPGFQVSKNLSKQCTKIEPFNISKPNAYHDKLKKLDETIEKENLDLQKKREFKAQYPHVIFEEPFIPERPSRYCQVDEFNLHSEARGVERKKFDLELEEQRLEMEKVKVSTSFDRIQVTEVPKELKYQNDFVRLTLQSVYPFKFLSFYKLFIPGGEREETKRGRSKGSSGVEEEFGSQSQQGWGV